MNRAYVETRGTIVVKSVKICAGYDVKPFTELFALILSNCVHIVMLLSVGLWRNRKFELRDITFMLEVDWLARRTHRPSIGNRKMKARIRWACELTARSYENVKRCT